MSNDLNIRIRQISQEIASSFVKNYKCSLEEAERFFYDNICGNEEIRKIIMNAASDKQLSKNGAFREFIKKNKKDLYYKLRKYKSSDDALVDAVASAENDATEERRIELLGRVADFHVSSQERVSYNALFYQKLAIVIGAAATVADVGCGVQPLFLPRAQFPSLEKYIALDKDRESVELMQKFKSTFKEQYAWLHPQVWNIGNGWEQVRETAGINTFDAALLLKLVPVVKRISPALVEALAKCPAETMIISGVKEAMVKKQDVERRERKAISNFIAASGRKAVDEFELENEFFIIVN
jgi:hypothetical protein